MTVIDEYLATFSGPEKEELERIRKIVIATVPEAQEVITYGMPGFKYMNKYLISFTIFKDHLGLFPTSKPIDSLKAKLSGYKLSRGGIQFTVNNPLPEPLIKEIVLYRVAVILKS